MSTPPSPLPPGAYAGDRPGRHVRDAAELLADSRIQESYLGLG